MNDGSNVEYFAVRYKDNNGAAQTKYIFPNGGSFKTTREYVGSIISSLHAYSYLIMVPYIDWDKADKDSMRKVINETEFDGLKLKNLQTLQFTKNQVTDMKPLQPWSVNEYLFTAPTGMTEVTGIEAFVSKGEWTIQGMTVSKVIDIGGNKEYGFYSGQYFTALGKQKLAEFKSKKSGAATISASKDMLVNVGGSSSPYFNLKKTDQTIANPMQDLYTFRLDIADRLDAGLETLLRNDTVIDKVTDLRGIEDLALEIEYSDKNGWTRVVTMPVLLSVIGQNMLLKDEVKTIGLAQRGDSLSFTGCLPEFSSLISARVYAGKAARDRISETGGLRTLKAQTVIDAQKKLQQAREAGVESKQRDAQNVYERAVVDYNESMEQYADLDSSDYIALSGIYLYKGTCRMTNTPSGTDPLTNESLPSFTYTYAYSEKKPIYGFSTTIEDGYRINPGTSDKVDMAAFTDESQMLSAQYPGNFLVRLKTGDAYGAGTTGGIKVQITYQNYKGNQVTSQIYDVKEEVTNYLGYWPSTTDKKSDYAFNYNAQTGRYLDFPVTLEDAAAIISVDVSLDSYTNDEWQFGGVAMYVIDSIGSRRIYARDTSIEDTSDPTLRSYQASHYVIVRSVTKTLLPPFPFTIEKLLTPGDRVPLDIGKGTVMPVTDVDYNSMRYSMTYKQTQLNFGFIKSRKIYDIDVKVADDGTSSNANGDSGSHNQFYFQLIFKNGTSACVLANQQLSADGFRAGFDERFAISVNRDYGELTDVRIIPEDTSTESDVYDKLNIDEITVTERTYGGASTQYVIQQVGWVGMGIIDYRDSAEISSIKGSEGRYLNSVSRKYHVSDKRNVTNFLCEVSTLPWDTDYVNVQGSISCDIEYIDDNDQPRTVSFDVVSLMADYMKKTPIYYEAPSDGSQDALYVNMGTVSDPRWMLRPNHKDRFILPGIANVKSLKTINFTATSRNNKPGKWVIGGISVSRVLTDDGTVELSKKYSEYIRRMETEPFCNTGSGSKELFMPAGTAESVMFEFSENEVTWAEDKSWPAAVSRIPDSTNDTVNIYLFPHEDTPDIENVNVKVNCQYSIPFSKVVQTKESTMRVYGSGTADAMFYVNGLSVRGMESLAQLGVECRNSRIVFDRALVQQVRDGVIVNSYQVTFGNMSAIYGLEAPPDNYVEVRERNNQKLLVQFDSVTEEMTLFEKDNQNNIAVALKYRSTLDHSDNDYYTPYIYLTDIGINKIYPGMMAEIPFEIPYMSEITGYRIVSYGNIKANVASALAANYSHSAKQEDPETGKPVYADETLLGTYSFNETFALSSAIKEAKVTATGMTGKGSVIPVDVYFKTAAAQEGIESGTDSLVEMTVAFTDYNGNPKTLLIKDLRAYIQSDVKTFKTGETTKVSFFIPELRELESFTIIPKDGTGRANWTIETIEGRIGIGEPTFSRAVNQTFTEAENGGVIALKNVNISTIVTTSDGYLGPTIGHLKEFTMEGGTTAAFSVRVDGGLGYEVKAAWLVNDTETDASQLLSAITNTGAAGSFRFAAPKNTTSVPQTYVIEVSAKDNPSVKDILRVTIPVPAAAAAPTAQPSDEYYDDYDDSAHDNWGDDNEDSTADQTAPESSQSSQDSTTPSVDDSTPSGENVFTDTTTSQSGSGEQQTP